MSKLEIIVASTRPGRVGLPVGRWLESEAKQHNGFTDVELVDLAEWNLPFMDEPNHPRLGNYVHQHTRDWSSKIAEADAFVFVMPEYNYGFNAPLKNAIDYLYAEWLYKPVGFASYGGVSAGTRAAQMIKQVVSALKMVPVVEAVSIPFVQQFLTEDGTITPTDVMTSAAKDMLDELHRMSDTLRPIRLQR
ncbi:NAD(P)H-dependent oxidoreductase [Mycolicibacterium smegmatis]|uniref:NADPH-dependent FMN reductase n=1 Tax=Mycolicibacterium smegmatis TaxID=1772 RepID=UPI001E5FA1C4|nr:NAD(P)H-dependent oxidoreductase [Mycolicibacterium smegmatis]UGU32511.1 NAD(P)H-dependent oxidoreductase [Mycolicibacterium smegmatis]ULN67403.1 NAD(P)H-dependent oxidoreductase [Mycolicibacterium smegmatis]